MDLGQQPATVVQCEVEEEAFKQEQDVEQYIVRRGPGGSRRVLKLIRRRRHNYYD